VDKRRFRDGTFEDGDGRSEDGMVLVRFELPATVSATTVSVCGDFNGWRAEAHPLTRLDDGRFRTDVALPAGERYRFRYLLDGQRWENDPLADDYVPNGFGAEDSVVDLTDYRSLPDIDATAFAAASATPGGPWPETGSAHTAPAGIDSPVRPQPWPQSRLGLQRLRLRRETWERIETEAALRNMEPQEFIAHLLEAAMSPHVWPVIQPQTHAEDGRQVNR
jgi:hypothetical protein